MEFRIDRTLSLPIRHQIKGMIEYGIACGEFAIGEALPSVRQLAEELSVSPMTISQAYADLKSEGLIETRLGAGTFVADSVQAQMAAMAEIATLHAEIDALLDHAEAMGVRRSDLAQLVKARLTYRSAAGSGVSVVMAGLFTDATRSYARVIAAQLGVGVAVWPVTISMLRGDGAARARAASADLIVTFHTLRPEIATLLPNTAIAAIRFIPSEETRRALASLDPLARVGVLSRFPDFLPIIRAGVQRFAAHVTDLVTAAQDDPGAAAALADRTVVIFSTGADAGALTPAGAQLVEYRHMPDPGDVDRIVRPFADRLVRPAPNERKDAS